jgi:hypothetical protein
MNNDNNSKNPSKMLTNYLIIKFINITLQTVSRLDPKFIALHCQEVGGKSYAESMRHVEDFVRCVKNH